MADAQHTPAPWADICGYITIKSGHNVASVNSHNTSEGKANARLIAAAPDLYAAAEFAKAAIEALRGYEADAGEELPDDHEIGRIEDSRHSASFRIRVGHIRRLAAAIEKANA
jgi:hypothetical protein